MDQVKTKKAKQLKAVTETVMVEVKKIYANPLNDDLFGSNESGYALLHNSISTKGFLPEYPIVCARYKNKTTILSGHRRAKAARELKIDFIPAIIHAIDPASPDAQLIMIEANLCRPLETRNFSPLERFILAEKLLLLIPDGRGGDHKSADFKSADKNSDTSEHRVTTIARIVGRSESYLRMLLKTARTIIDQLSIDNRQLLDVKEISEKIRVASAIESESSKDLTKLTENNVKLYKLFVKYCKKPKAPRATTDTATDEQNRNDSLSNHYSNVINALGFLIEADFKGVEAAAETLELLSSMAATPADALQRLDAIGTTITEFVSKIRSAG